MATSSPKPLQDTPNLSDQKDFTGFNPLTGVAIDSKKNVGGKTQTNEDRAEEGLLEEFEALAQLSPEARKEAVTWIAIEATDELMRHVKASGLALRTGAAMCTTAIIGDMVFTWNVGDSLTVINEINAQNQSKYTQLTNVVHNVKHLLTTPRESLTAEACVECDRLNELDDFKYDPSIHEYRIGNRLALSRTLGMLSLEKKGVLHEISFASHNLDEKQTTCIATFSDGVTDYFDNNEKLATFFRENADLGPEALAKKLTEVASDQSLQQRRKIVKKPFTDDTTAIICQIKPGMRLPASFFSVYDGQGGPQIARLLRTIHRTILKNTARKLIPALLRDENLTAEAQNFQQKFGEKLPIPKQMNDTKAADSKVTATAAAPLPAAPLSSTEEAKKQTDEEQKRRAENPMLSSLEKIPKSIRLLVPNFDSELSSFSKNLDTQAGQALLTKVHNACILIVTQQQQQIQKLFAAPDIMPEAIRVAANLQTNHPTFIRYTKFAQKDVEPYIALVKVIQKTLSSLTGFLKEKALEELPKKLTILLENYPKTDAKETLFNFYSRIRETTDKTKSDINFTDALQSAIRTISEDNPSIKCYLMQELLAKVSTYANPGDKETYSPLANTFKPEILNLFKEEGDAPAKKEKYAALILKIIAADQVAMAKPLGMFEKRESKLAWLRQKVLAEKLFPNINSEKDLLDYAARAQVAQTAAAPPAAPAKKT